MQAVKTTHMCSSKCFPVNKLNLRVFKLSLCSKKIIFTVKIRNAKNLRITSNVILLMGANLN